MTDDIRTSDTGGTEIIGNPVPPVPNHNTT